MNHQHPKRALITIALAITSSVSFALPTDFQQAISIEADQAYFDQKQGSANYNGNVVVKQGSITIEAEELSIVTHPETGEFQSLSAKGTPSRFSQQIDENGTIMSANGNTLDYDVSKGQLEIHDNGYLKRGDDEISADYIHYLLNQGTFKAENRGSGRVNMTLQPSITE